ncbi:MAG: BMP family ABC transporter substrate-binding protein [Clostridia bacterium]|nr:BMP family ABC transporter substrate-binding protein [Clostridia bacterium]
MKKAIWIIMSAVILATLCCIAFACDNPSVKPDEKEEPSLNFDMVYALAEEAGYQGTLEELIEAFKGESAYQIAVANGYQGTQTEWLAALQGAAGKDGISPTIGENGHWFIGTKDTGVIAEGKDGSTPTIEIDTNGYWVINGKTLGIKAMGENGKDSVLSVDEDGYILVNGEKTDTCLYIEKHTHTYGDWFFVKENCLEAGFRVKACTICGNTVGEYLAPIGHSEKEIDPVVPACTEPGHTKIVVCERCGEVLDEGEEIPSLGHQWGKDSTCIRCGETKPLKIGLICLHDAESSYDADFIYAILEVKDTLGLDDDQVCILTGISESEECISAAEYLVAIGCNIIFANSYGHEQFLLYVAKNNPDVQFCHATGTRARTEGLPNFHNVYASIYEGRYLTGIAVGQVLNWMISFGYITADQAKIGFVGAYTYGEVISAYSAFYLGAKSVCPSVTMEVSFTGSWFDSTAEKAAAENLISRGCLFISQTSPSEGALFACQETHTLNVPYNYHGTSDAALISCWINWTPYFKYLIETMQSGGEIATDFVGTLTDGSVEVSEILIESYSPIVSNASLAQAKEGLLNGTIKVFDTSTFTVNGETLTSYIADVDDDGTYTPDTEIIKTNAVTGITYIAESEFRSAPSFMAEIDGITLLNRAY